METTIRLDGLVKQKLDLLKVHSRESYSDVIKRIIENGIVKNVGEESLKETIEILSDPEMMRDIANSLEEINKGNYGTSLEEIQKELRL